MASPAYEERVQQMYKAKMRSQDRILVLEPIDGDPKTTTGIIDRRIFTGENKLHAIQNPQNSLWYFKYESGILPQPLKMQFTSFNKMLAHAKDYFSRRNIVIKEVID